MNVKEIEIPKGLVFSSEDVCRRFLNAFYDLIEKANELL